MTRTQPPMSIVVGIDGSEAGVLAAQWAADEAISRDLPLRLVHIIEPGSEAVRLETEYAQLALQTARAAVEALSPRIRIETAVKRGDIGAVLARESRNAEMICIGTAATSVPDRQTANSTSTTLARSAQCPVAVVGTPDGSVGTQSGCLAVIVDGSDTSVLMVGEALTEARIRGLPLMVVEARSPAGDDPSRNSFGRRLAQLLLGYPDVAVHRVAVQSDVGAFLSQIGPSVAMTIIDRSALDREVRLLNPHTEQAGLHQRAQRGLSLVSEQHSPSPRSCVVEQDSTSGQRTPL